MGPSGTQFLYTGPQIVKKLQFSAKIDGSMCAYYWISAENVCRLWWLEFGVLWVAPADDGRLHFLLTDRLRTRRV